MLRIMPEQEQMPCLEISNRCSICEYGDKIGGIGMELQKRQEQWFEHLHRNPELSMQEYDTTAYLKKILGTLPVRILPWTLPTGVVAELAGGQPGPVIALRADIDALPVAEDRDHTLRSEREGVMHACGHDFHMTSLLGAVVLLCEKREQIRGTVRFLFQPAEEAEHGAQKVVETGIMNDVDAVFGLHVDEDLPTGVIAISPGPCNAACDRFLITIDGVGCHGAHPELGINPITAAAQLINSFQGIIAGGISAFDQAVLSVTRVESGTSWNVIPDQAQVEGTVRTMEEPVRQKVRARMEEICGGIASVTGCRIRFQWLPGAPAVNNDPKLSEYIRKLALARHLEVRDMTVSMGGEDFSCYQEFIPGAFFHIGVASPAPLHNPGFRADTTCLSEASELLAAAVVEYERG